MWNRVSCLQIYNNHNNDQHLFYAILHKFMALSMFSNDIYCVIFPLHNQLNVLQVTCDPNGHISLAHMWPIKATHLHERSLFLFPTSGSVSHLHRLSILSMTSSFNFESRLDSTMDRIASAQSEIMPTCRISQLFWRSRKQES